MPKQKLPLYYGGNLRVNQLQVTSGSSLGDVTANTITVTSGAIVDGGMTRFEGPTGVVPNGASGVAVELEIDSSVGRIQVYDRTQSSYETMQLRAAFFDLAVGMVSMTAQPRCRLGTTIETSAVTPATTVLNWGDEVFDVGGMHTTANNTRITAPTTGLYQIRSHLNWDNTTDNNAWMWILRGGSVLVEQNVWAAADQAVTLLDDASAGVYWEVRIRQNGDSDANVLVGTSGTWFEAVKLA